LINCDENLQAAPISAMVGGAMEEMNCLFISPLPFDKKLTVIIKHLPPIYEGPIREYLLLMILGR
jgi:hypothetical protein